MDQFFWCHFFVLICFLTATPASSKVVKTHATRAIDTDTPNAKRRFNSARAQEFLVDGKNLPLVDFDIGDSYSGSLPTSDDPNASTKLFFWFLPSQGSVGANDLTLWTNGGPGCSSFIGVTTENGPFTWGAKAIPNPHSWNKLSNMLYIEHPAPVGYSEGKTPITSELDVARPIFGFMQQFLEVFPELKNFNFWVTGESYGGYYVPYIFDYFSQQASLALKLQGTLMVDPIFGDGVLHFEVPAYPFVKLNQDAFQFNTTFMAHLAELHHTCGFDEYLDKYMTFPPPGPFELPKPGSTEVGGYNQSCEIYELVVAGLSHSKNFNYYNVHAKQTGRDYIAQDEVYFNRADVRKALHVPSRVHKWTACSSSKNIFPHGDSSEPPAWAVYPRVIEKSKRSVIAYGAWDFRLLADGAKLVIQNMTWSGAQGLSQPITVPLNVQGQGRLGNFRTDRGLTFVEVEQAGHMIPKDQPQAAYQILEFLLGQRDSPSA